MGFLLLAQTAQDDAEEAEAARIIGADRGHAVETAGRGREVAAIEPAAALLEQELRVPGRLQKPCPDQRLRRIQLLRLAVAGDQLARREDTVGFRFQRRAEAADRVVQPAL